MSTSTALFEKIEKLWELMTPEEQRHCVRALARLVDAVPDGQLPAPIINVVFSPDATVTAMRNSSERGHMMGKELRRHA